RVQLLEMTAIPRLALREEASYLSRRDGTMLETALREHWHRHAQHGADSARGDLALELVQPLSRAHRQCCKWNRLGDGNHRRTRVRAECAEPVLTGTGVAAHAAATVAARVRQRVLDRLDAPSFLVEHPIVDNAMDRQLAVFLDRVI